MGHKDKDKEKVSIDKDIPIRIMDTNSGAIEDVLIVYGVNSGAELVNYINYTGFTVGQSVLTINGLYTPN